MVRHTFTRARGRCGVESQQLPLRSTAPACAAPPCPPAAAPGFKPRLSRNLARLICRTVCTVHFFSQPKNGQSFEFVAFANSTSPIHGDAHPGAYGGAAAHSRGGLCGSRPNGAGASGGDGGLHAADWAALRAESARRRRRRFFHSVIHSYSAAASGRGAAAAGHEVHRRVLPYPGPFPPSPRASS